MGALSKLEAAGFSSDSGALSKLSTLDLVAVRGHTRGRPTKSERRAALRDEFLSLPGQLEANPSLAAATNALPAIGSTIGTMAGVPIGAALGIPAGGVGAIPGGMAGRTVGGGLGGAAGEVAKELMLGQRLNPRSIGKQAALGGGLSVLGEAAPAVLGPAAKGIMSIALKSTPEVAQTAIREGITATKAGFKKLLDLIGKAGAAERTIVRAAAGRGAGFAPAQDLADAAWKRSVDKLVGGTGDDWSRVAVLRDKFIRDNARDVSPVSLLEKRKYYDTVSRSAQNAQARGGRLKLDPADVWNQAMGDEIRTHLRQNIPAISDPTAYQRLMGRPVNPSELQQLRDVLLPASTRGGFSAGRVGRSAATMAVGGALGGTAVSMLPAHNRYVTAAGTAGGLLAGSPAAMSMLALAGANPMLQGLLQLMPRLAMMEAAPAATPEPMKPF